MARNLTGNKRIISDSCIELYNAVQKWRNVVADSHSIIKNIWSIKLEEMNRLNLMKEKNNASSLDLDDEIYKELGKLSSELHSKVQCLEVISKKIQGIYTKFKAISELSDLHQSNSNTSILPDDVPFQIWSISKFSAVAEEIDSMFEKELLAKSSMAKELCVITKKSTFSFFEICWKYEPNIAKRRLNFLLNGIICELDLSSEIN